MEHGAVPVIGPVFPEKAALQMAQRRCIFICQRFEPNLAAGLIRQAPQTLQRFQRRLEYFLPAVRLPQQRNGHRPRLPQKYGQNAPLLRVEVCKAINEDILVPDVCRLLQMLAQLRHSVPGIQPRPPETCLIGAVQQAQVQ